MTVLRDGRHVVTAADSQTSIASALIEAMIGRPLEAVLPEARRRARPAGSCCAVEGLSSPPGFRDVSFSRPRRRGRGLRRPRRRRTVARWRRRIFGLDPTYRPAMCVRGEPVRSRDRPREAIARGIGLVPEDRKRQGLVLSMSVLHNATLAVLGALARRWRSSNRRAEAVGDRSRCFDRLRVPRRPLDTPVAALSGGNQQKIVLTQLAGGAMSDVLIARRADPRRGRRRQGRDPRAHRRARQAAPPSC